jgi:hypothetical protein
MSVYQDCTVIHNNNSLNKLEYGFQYGKELGRSFFWGGIWMPNLTQQIYITENQGIPSHKLYPVTQSVPLHVFVTNWPPPDQSHTQIHIQNVWMKGIQNKIIVSQIAFIIYIYGLHHYKGKLSEFFFWVYYFLNKFQCGLPWWHNKYPDNIRPSSILLEPCLVLP